MRSLGGDGIVHRVSYEAHVFSIQNQFCFWDGGIQSSSSDPPSQKKFPWWRTSTVHTSMHGSWVYSAHHPMGRLMVQSALTRGNIPRGASHGVRPQYVACVPHLIEYFVGHLIRRPIWGDPSELHRVTMLRKYDRGGAPFLVSEGWSLEELHMPPKL